MNTSTTNKRGLFGSDRSRPPVPTRIVEALGEQFSTDEMQALGRLGTLVEVDPGHELTVELQTGREAFVVVSGTIDVVRKGEVLATIGPGAILGEAALINAAPRGATAVATTGVSVFVLNPAEFSSLMAACPRLARRIRDLAAKHRSGTKL